MFDVSFFELLVIGVVALVVIGPEKLPDAIKTCALWIGRIKRILAESRSEFEKHIGADEIRRELHNEHIMASLEKLKASRAILEQDLLNYQNTIQAELHALEHGVESKPDSHSSDDSPSPTVKPTGEMAELEMTESQEISDISKITTSDTSPHSTEDPAPKTKSEHD